MKPGSLDSSGDVEYYAFYILLYHFYFLRYSTFKGIFWDLCHGFNMGTRREGEATLHVNRCSKLAVSTLRSIVTLTGNMYYMCLNFSVYDVKDV